MKLRDTFIKGSVSQTRRKLSDTERKILTGGKLVSKINKNEIQAAINKPIFKFGLKLLASPIDIEQHVLIKLGYNSNLGSPSPTDIYAYILQEFPNYKLVDHVDRKAGIIELTLEKKGTELSSDEGTADFPVDGKDQGLVRESIEGTGKIGQYGDIKPWGNKYLNQILCKCGDGDAYFNKELNFWQCTNCGGKVDKDVKGPPLEFSPTTNLDREAQMQAPASPAGGMPPPPPPPISEEQSPDNQEQEMTLEEALGQLEEASQVVINKVRGGETILEGKEVESIPDAPQPAGSPQTPPTAAAQPIHANKKVATSPEELKLLRARQKAIHDEMAKQDKEEEEAKLKDPEKAHQEQLSTYERDLRKNYGLESQPASSGPKTSRPSGRFLIDDRLLRNPHSVTPDERWQVLTPEGEFVSAEEQEDWKKRNRFLPREEGGSNFTVIPGPEEYKSFGKPHEFVNTVLDDWANKIIKSKRDTKKQPKAEIIKYMDQMSKEKYESLLKQITSITSQLQSGHASSMDETGKETQHSLTRDERSELLQYKVYLLKQVDSILNAAVRKMPSSQGEVGDTGFNTLPFYIREKLQGFNPNKLEDEMKNRFTKENETRKQLKMDLDEVNAELLDPSLTPDDKARLTEERADIIDRIKDIGGVSEKANPYLLPPDWIEHEKNFNANPESGRRHVRYPWHRLTPYERQKAWDEFYKRDHDIWRTMRKLTKGGSIVSEATDDDAKDYFTDLYGPELSHIMTQGCCDYHDTRRADLLEIDASLDEDSVYTYITSLNKPYIVGALTDWAITAESVPPVEQMVDMAIELARTDVGLSRQLDKILLRSLVANPTLVDQLTSESQRNILVKALRQDKRIYNSLINVHTKAMNMQDRVEPKDKKALIQRSAELTLMAFKNPKVHGQLDDAVDVITMKDTATKPEIQQHIMFHHEQPHKDGIYTLMDISWDPDTKVTIGSMKQSIISYVKGLESKKEFNDLGFLGHIHVVDLDTEAGFATVKFRSNKGGDAIPAVVTA